MQWQPLRDRLGADEAKLPRAVLPPPRQVAPSDKKFRFGVSYQTEQRDPRRVSHLNPPESRPPPLPQTGSYRTDVTLIAPVWCGLLRRSLNRTNRPADSSSQRGCGLLRCRHRTSHSRAVLWGGPFLCHVPVAARTSSHHSRSAASPRRCCSFVRDVGACCTMLPGNVCSAPRVWKVAH